MTVAFQRMFGILERWNNNQVTPSLSKPHELSYRSNNILRIKYRTGYHEYSTQCNMYIETYIKPREACKILINQYTTPNF